MNVDVIATQLLLPEQERTISALQSVAFADISQDEIAEDFFCPAGAHILALTDDEIVGYASIHHADIEFQG